MDIIYALKSNWNLCDFRNKTMNLITFYKEAGDDDFDRIFKESNEFFDSDDRFLMKKQA